MKKLLLILITIITSNCVLAVSTGSYSYQTKLVENVISLSMVTESSLLMNYFSTQSLVDGYDMGGLVKPIKLSKVGNDYIYTKNSCSIRLTNIMAKSFEVVMPDDPSTCGEQQVMSYGYRAPRGDGVYKYKNAKIMITVTSRM